ncbi:carboxylesterase family protein [Streptomyces sp. NPDC101219]|uniref:carboxylesterase family protein n=1 Tax=Streptomyces sp. NPDC101219 TaxID=3366131 RepID=UPI00380D5E88
MGRQRTKARHTPVHSCDFAEAEAPYFQNVPRPTSFPLGTGRMVDLTFLFDNDLFEPLDDTQARLSDTVVGYWSRFASTGQVNGHGLPTWKRFTHRSPYVQRLAAGRIGRTDFRGPSPLRLLEGTRLSWWAEGCLRGVRDKRPRLTPMTRLLLASAVAGRRRIDVGPV